MAILDMQVAALMRLCVAETKKEREEAKQELRRLMAAPRKRAWDPEREIRDILLELGAPDHLVGHPYVVKGIELVVKDQLLINSITFGLYPQLAAHFDTTASRVERAIRHLIEVTWLRGDLDVLDQYFGNTIDVNRGKPTNGEFIARISNVVRQRMKDTAA